MPLAHSIRVLLARRCFSSFIIASLADIDTREGPIAGRAGGGGGGGGIPGWNGEGGGGGGGER